MQRLVMVLGLLLATAVAWGAQKAISLDKLCRKSEHIVIGTVESIDYHRADWPGIGNIPFTNVAIAVTEEWKGKVPGETLIVQVPGGKNPDGSRMVVSETPHFQVGEKVLVFTSTFNNAQWVYGWEQGKYTVVVQRVVGKPGFPVAKDILTYPLKRRIEGIVRDQAREKKREG